MVGGLVCRQEHRQLCFRDGHEAAMPWVVHRPGLREADIRSLCCTTGGCRPPQGSRRSRLKSTARKLRDKAHKLAETKHHRTGKSPVNSELGHVSRGGNGSMSRRLVLLRPGDVHFSNALPNGPSPCATTCCIDDTKSATPLRPRGAFHLWNHSSALVALRCFLAGDTY